MRYFIDSEFHEDGRLISPISIGIVAEDGREFYREGGNPWSNSYSPWVREHVLPHLTHFNHTNADYLRCQEAELPECPWRSLPQLRRELLAFCGEQPEFWGYYCAYDWVLVCQLFGTMMDLPKDWPQFAYDLRQALNMTGRYLVAQPDTGRHHALDDARWIAATHAKYNGLPALAPATFDGVTAGRVRQLLADLIVEAQPGSRGRDDGQS